MDKSEFEIMDEMDFSVYLSLFKSVMPEHIDLYYLSRKNVTEDIKLLFNRTLLICKQEFNISLFDILIELSTKYMEPKALSGLINNRVKWELMEEIKNNHSFINKHYYNNTLFEFFH